MRVQVAFAERLLHSSPFISHPEEHPCDVEHLKSQNNTMMTQKTILISDYGAKSPANRIIQFLDV